MSLTAILVTPRKTTNYIINEYHFIYFYIVDDIVCE